MHAEGSTEHRLGTSVVEHRLLTATISNYSGWKCVYKKKSILTTNTQVHLRDYTAHLRITASQLKMCDFSEETVKGFEVP